MSSSQQQLFSFSTHLKLAAEAEEANDIPTAFEHYRQCHESRPGNSDLKQKYISYFKKNFENENSKKSQDELKLSGNEFMQDNKFEEALIAYTAAIDLDPSVEAAAAIYSNRSLCFYNLEKYQEAYDDGCMASLLRPEWPRGWMRRATAGMKMENYEDAHECYEKYFELDPEGAKSDAEVVKNRNLMRKKVEQLAASKRKNEQRLGNLKTEILSIENKTEREQKATQLLSDSITRGTHGEAQKIDIEVAQLAIECGVGAAPLVLRTLLLSRLAFQEQDRSLDKLDALIRLAIAQRQHETDGADFSPLILGLACRAHKGHHSVNPDIILALLHTQKFDVNAFHVDDGFTPLYYLAEASNNLTPDGQLYPATMAALHSVLNWEGIDVNRHCRPPNGERYTPLMIVRHPDVAKLLLRHGANVHIEGLQQRHGCSERKSVNALGFAALNVHKSHQAELLRVLIGAGGRLVADGLGKKSSLIMLDVFLARDGKWITNEALQILLQLNKVQGLEMMCRDPTSGVCESFLIHAIVFAAPPRILEQLCSMDPSSVNQVSFVRCDGPCLLEMTPLEAALCVWRGYASIDLEEHCGPYVSCDARQPENRMIDTITMLLNHGADLLQKTYGGKSFTTVFAKMYHNLSKIENKKPLQSFLELVKQKRGDDFLQKCMETLPKKSH